MGRINTPPYGLQYLLGSTNFGDNPSELGDATLPTLEQFKFLGARNIHYARTSVTFTARNQTIPINIPTNEAWEMISVAVGVFGFNDIASEMRLRVDIRNQPNAAGANIGMPVFETGILTPGASGNIGDVLGETFAFPTTYILQPGSSLFLRDVVARFGATGQETCEIQIMYYRYKV